MKINDIKIILALILICIVAGWLVRLIFDLIFFIPLIAGSIAGYVVGYYRGSSK
jgi:hypothetical protein